MQRASRSARSPLPTMDSSEFPQHNPTPTGPSSPLQGPKRQKRGRLVAAVRAPAPLPASSDDETDVEPCIAFEGEDGLDVSFPLKAVERSFRCSLCNGYFRDAVTIKECLHTFCRWCLYSYVEGGETEEVCCPFCERNMQLTAPHRDGKSVQCCVSAYMLLYNCFLGLLIQRSACLSSISVDPFVIWRIVVRRADDKRLSWFFPASRVHAYALYV